MVRINMLSVGTKLVEVVHVSGGGAGICLRCGQRVVTGGGYVKRVRRQRVAFPYYPTPRLSGPRS